MPLQGTITPNLPVDYIVAFMLPYRRIGWFRLTGGFPGPQSAAKGKCCTILNCQCKINEGKAVFFGFAFSSGK